MNLILSITFLTFFATIGNIETRWVSNSGGDSTWQGSRRGNSSYSSNGYGYQTHTTPPPAWRRPDTPNHGNSWGNHGQNNYNNGYWYNSTRGSPSVTAGYGQVNNNGGGQNWNSGLGNTNNYNHGYRYNSTRGNPSATAGYGQGNNSRGGQPWNSAGFRPNEGGDRSTNSPRLYPSLAYFQGPNGNGETGGAAGRSFGSHNYGNSSYNRNGPHYRK